MSLKQDLKDEAKKQEHMDGKKFKMFQAEDGSDDWNYSSPWKDDGDMKLFKDD